MDIPAAVGGTETSFGYPLTGLSEVDARVLASFKWP